jgi:hypothetical protein
MPAFSGFKIGVKLDNMTAILRLQEIIKFSWEEIIVQHSHRVWCTHITSQTD